MIPTANSSAPRRIVVGDVHGHYDTLLRLLALIGPGAQDEVYFVGDLIDRGAGSAQVVELVRREGYHTLIGNHEQLLIQAMADYLEFSESIEYHPWFYSGGMETLESYGRDLDKLEADMRWLYEQPFYYDLGDFWLVHAGVDPDRSVSEQSAHDLCWIRGDFHTIDRPYFADKTIVTGHTITFTLPNIAPGMIAQGPGWLDIDTGAYHPRSGWLTALDLDQQMVYQANAYSSATWISPLADRVQSYKSPVSKSPVSSQTHAMCQ